MATIHNGFVAAWFDYSASARFITIDQWLRTLKRRLPQSQGSILLKLKTNEDGAVMAADIMGGDALPQIKQFIVNHAKANLRLAIGTPSEVLMPELEMVI